MPDWCEFGFKVVVAEQLDRAGVCASLEEPLDNCTTEEFPWFTEEDPHRLHGPIALFVPRGPDRFERLELAEYSHGTEEIEELQFFEVRSKQPLDASIVMRSQTKLCDDDDLCAFEDHYETLIAVTRLSDGRYLVATTYIYLPRREVHPVLFGARVVVAGDQVDVWGCNGHARLPLPEGVPPQPVARTRLHSG